MYIYKAIHKGVIDGVGDNSHVTGDENDNPSTTAESAEPTAAAWSGSIVIIGINISIQAAGVWWPASAVDR